MTNQQKTWSNTLRAKTGVVANAILKHKELAPEIIIAIRKAVSKEFSDYLKCESMLLARNPDELAGFSNKLFINIL